MPWSKVPGSETDECSDGDIAVIKDEDGSVEGCHATEEDADDQLAALNASEENAMDVFDQLEEKIDAFDEQETDSDAAESNTESSPKQKSAVGERRTMGFETKDFEVKQDDGDEEFVFTAYGAVFGNKDRGGDILQRGAFKRTIDQNDGRFPLVADHNLGDMGSRLGVAYAKEDSHGVRVKGHVNTDTQAGREVASHIRHAEKHDLALGMSFGYKVREDDFDSDKNARLLKEVENYEFTVTQIPMNPEAQVQGVKAILDDERALDELERELKSRLLSDDDFVNRLSEKRRDSEPAPNSDPMADLEAELTEELQSLKSELQSNG